MVNVMLIDDHPVVRAGLRAILNTFSDVEVVMEGSTGADVDKLFTDDAPQVDAVVCDIQMPGMDGIAATKRVVEAGGPPVLILTTYDTQADILAAVEVGAMGRILVVVETLLMFRLSLSVRPFSRLVFESPGFCGGGG